MNIYMNARFLTQSVTGVQRYAVELAKQWDRLLDSGELPGDDVRITLLCPRKIRYDLPLKHIRTRRVGLLNGHAWEQLELPLYAWNGLLVNPCNTGPMLKRNQVAMLHDTAVFAQPASYSFAFRNAYRLIQRAIGRTAKAVLTNSEFSKSQLMEHCRIDGRKIKVTYLGREHMDEIRPDYGVYERIGVAPKRYLLAVSSRNPSKNFANTVKAIERLGASANYRIVIAGGVNGKVFGSSELPPSDNVIEAGYVSDGELKALYEGAACFVYPSFYEGFGLPPLEAMSCGTPVVVSHAASLPEVCGEAGLYCDPHSPHDIARQIERVMTDPDVRDGMSARGVRQAGRFSWQACARQTFDVIKEAMQP